MLRRILVTGSSKGIGKAIALRLAKDGFAITVHCRSGMAAAQETVEEIIAQGGQADLIQCDVSDREGTKNTLAQSVEKHGAFYGVVCNAGITADTAFPAMTEDEWDKVIHTNLDGFYNVFTPSCDADGAGKKRWQNCHYGVCFWPCWQSRASEL